MYLIKPSFLRSFVLTFAIAAAPPVFAVPALSTPFLYLMDNETDSVIRLDENGNNGEVIVSADQLLSLPSVSSTGHSGNGIAFDETGSMYFASNDNLYKRTSQGLLSLLSGGQYLADIQGTSFSDIDGIAYGNDGFIYANDDATDQLLKINTSTGQASVHTTSAQLDLLFGTGEADLESGIVAGSQAGEVYILNADVDDNGTSSSPEALVHIAANGSASVVASGAPFTDLKDAFLARDSSGNIYVANDNTFDEKIIQVRPDGINTTFISNSRLEAGTGDVDLIGGITFDAQDNFYVADEDEDNIYRFDATTGNKTIFASEASISAVTGSSTGADLEAGIAWSDVKHEARPSADLGIPLSALDAQVSHRVTALITDGNDRVYSQNVTYGGGFGENVVVEQSVDIDGVDLFFYQAPGVVASTRAELVNDFGILKASVTTSNSNTDNLYSTITSQTSWSDYFVIVGGEGSDIATVNFDIHGIFDPTGDATMSFNLFQRNISESFAGEANLLFNFYTSSTLVGGSGEFLVPASITIPFEYDVPFELITELVLDAINNGSANFSNTIQLTSIEIPLGTALGSSAISNGLITAQAYHVIEVPLAPSIMLFLIGLAILSFQARTKSDNEHR